jgi:hypothetical protein
MTIPAGKYALARFELGDDEYQEAWYWVYRTWLPESSYLPDDRPCFEMFHNDPKTHPKGSNHYSLTDLVRKSPILCALLGGGYKKSGYDTLEFINQKSLVSFDKYLKLNMMDNMEQDGLIPTITALSFSS